MQFVVYADTKAHLEQRYTCAHKPRQRTPRQPPLDFVQCLRRLGVPHQRKQTHLAPRDATHGPAQLVCQVMREAAAVLHAAQIGEQSGQVKGAAKKVTDEEFVVGAAELRVSLLQAAIDLHGQKVVVTLA